ncbi:MAG: S41 family peptidase [Rhizobiaceae bacterium]|nr:S41 family peptidase [Rhizobiaceae bacterium]
MTEAQSTLKFQLTKQQLIEDLTTTYELLEQLQPNFTKHKNAGELKALRDQLIASVKQSNSADEAFLKLTELTGAVCDEHTTVIKRERYWNYVPAGWPWYDEPLVVKGGKLYIELSTAKNKVEVVEINGIEGSYIASQIAIRMPNDGCLQTGALFIIDKLGVSGHIFNALVGKQDSYRVRYLDPHDSTPKDLEIIPRTANANHISQRAFFKKRSHRTNYEYSTNKFFHRLLDPAMEKANLNYFFSIPRNIAYLRVGEFELMATAKEGIELVMRDIITKNPDALFLDLTGSPGGYSRSTQFLMSFLLPRAHRLNSKMLIKNVSKEPPANFQYFDKTAEDNRDHNIQYFKKIRPRRGIRSAPVKKQSFGRPDYKGKIYVLVGPWTRSNATNVASNLKRLRNATIVGNVTASNVKTTCARANGSIRLEQSGFRLYVPELCFESPENGTNGQSDLVPDIPVDIFNMALVTLEATVLTTALDHFDDSRAD